jgi:hypothetical protein
VKHVGYIRDYLEKFNSLEIVNPEDQKSINRLIEIILGYITILEDEKKSEPIYPSMERILFEQYRLKGAYAYIFSGCIDNLGIEDLVVLERNQKILAAEATNEFDHLLDVLENYSDNFEEGKDFKDSITSLKNAFNTKIAHWVNEKTKDSIQAWDFMDSQNKLSLDDKDLKVMKKKNEFNISKTKQNLERKLYPENKAPITPTSLASEEGNKQIYLKARTFEKLVRLFKTQTDMTPNAVKLFKKYVITAIKPFLNVLLGIFRKRELSEVDVSLESQFAKYTGVETKEEKQALTKYEFEQVNNYIESLENDIISEKKVDKEFKQIQHQFQILKEKFNKQTTIFKDNEERIFNLFKLLRFKYYSALKLLKIKDTSILVEKLKEVLPQNIEEYITLFKNQFDNLKLSVQQLGDNLKAKTTIRTIEMTKPEDSFTGVKNDDIWVNTAKDTEHAEFEFKKHFKLIFDNIEKIISKPLIVNNIEGKTEQEDELKLNHLKPKKLNGGSITVKNYIEWEIAHAEELHNLLQTFKINFMGEGIPNKESFVKDCETFLSKYFNMGGLEFDEYFENYFKFSEHLVTSLRELKALYDTKLKFKSGREIPLSDISHFKIEDKLAVDESTQIVSIRLFDWGLKELKSLEYRVGGTSDDYRELMRIVMSLEFVMTKFFLYFGNDNRTIPNKMLIYYDSKRIGMDVDEKHSLIYSYLDSIYH